VGVVGGVGRGEVFLVVGCVWGGFYLSVGLSLNVL